MSNLGYWWCFKIEEMYLWFKEYQIAPLSSEWLSFIFKFLCPFFSFFFSSSDSIFSFSFSLLSKSDQRHMNRQAESMHVWVRAQSCPALCNPMDYSPPGSSIHGIFQARILKWVAISSSRRSSQPKDWTHISYVSCIGRWILYLCVT